MGKSKKKAAEALSTTNIISSAPEKVKRVSEEDVVIKSSKKQKFSDKEPMGKKRKHKSDSPEA